MRNSVNFPSGIFLFDHACGIMHDADKAGALLRKLAFLELKLKFPVRQYEFALVQSIYRDILSYLSLDYVFPELYLAISSLKAIICYFHTLFPVRILTFPRHSVCVCRD